MPHRGHWHCLKIFLIVINWGQRWIEGQGGSKISHSAQTLPHPTKNDLAQNVNRANFDNPCLKGII